MARSLAEFRHRKVKPLNECAGCHDPELRRNMLPTARCVRCRIKERNRVWRESHPEETHNMIRKHRKLAKRGLLQKRPVYEGP